MQPDIEADFDRIVATDLRKIAVVAQCLDNQWVPQDLLADMLKEGDSLTDRKVARRLRRDARAEYLRALLNAEQVVVNRAFFYNNPVVSQDFRSKGTSRDAFKQLLNDHVIIPFLIREREPAQAPVYTADGDALLEWQTLLREVRPQCLRLSWTDADNDRYAKASLFDRFGRFLRTLGALDRQALGTDFGISEERARGLLRRLQEVNMWAWDREDITREQFYAQFVTKEGTPVAVGAYDRDKPFAAELKQLADLRYVTSLPDALDRYPLTPINSLHRTALQEERLIRPNEEPNDPNQLLETLLRRRAFDLVQQPLAVSLTGLTLEHIQQARKSGEWHDYIASLSRLVDEPLNFDQHANTVYRDYVRLARVLADMVGARDVTVRWVPVIKILIEFVGATMTVVFGQEQFVQTVGKIASQVAGTASTIIVRFVVASHIRNRAQGELGTGIEIMKLKFAQTEEAWRFLQNGFAAAGLPVHHSEFDETIEDDASMDNASPEPG